MARSVKVGTVFAAASLTFAAANAAIRFTITPAALEGDNVPSVGLVTRVDNLVINNAGSWIVEADTDNPDTDGDSVLLKDGVLLLQEGQDLTEPPGASIDSFDSVTLDSNGDSGWNFFLDGTSGYDDDSGVYFNADLVLQESTISMALEFTPGTPYIGFFEVKINDPGELLVMASVDDPAIPSSVDRALVVWDVDENGNLLSETVIVKEGDVLPGQTEAVSDLGTGPHQFAFNSNGDAMYFADLTGDTTLDGVIYINDTKLAQEGDTSPDPARAYQFLSSRGMDFNDYGDYVFKADLDGDSLDDYVLIRNGDIFRREGETIPAIAPFKFDGTSAFGSSGGPVQIDHCGNVFYFGDWDNPNTDIDSGLFLNDELIVQEGVTVVAGSPVNTINSGSDSFVLSDNGKYAIFEGELDDGRSGAFIIEFERCADFDDSGTVDLSDLAALLSAYGACVGDPGFDCQFDLDFDGCIGLSDLAQLLSLYGGPC
ncbi:MAG: hypothetical protein ACE5I3_01665 [Phycisphaerae bacterium]